MYEVWILLIIYYMDRYINTLGVFLFLCLFGSCTSYKNLYSKPSIGNKGGVNCVIEIPSGTNKKIEFNPSSNSFEVDQRNSKDRVISYLSYPGNYGFIPSTFSDPAKGGDGDALDVLLISESVPTGTVVEAIPIGVLRLIDAGEQDYKIICVPIDADKQIIKATSYSELEQNYPKIIEIITSWFLHYDSKDTLQINGWGDEKEAMVEIQKNKKS